MIIFIKKTEIQIAIKTKVQHSIKYFLKTKEKTGGLGKGKD